MEKIQKSQQNITENLLIIELAEEIYQQQNKVENLIEKNKLLKKHIKKIEHSEEQENSNKNSEENSQSSELPNNSKNLSDSQRTITQSQVNSDMEIKNIYKTLFYWALFLIGLLIFAAWYFWHDRNFYITLIERENVNIERE
ncbi:9951_t:CDS:2, partial [Scutellospora calospora]